LTVICKISDQTKLPQTKKQQLHKTVTNSVSHKSQLLDATKI